MDIGAPKGTYIALRVDCEVVATANQSGGYGLVIDVWVPQYGVQLRFAHNSSIIIKSGKIPAGTSFARVGSTGKSTGPHIHLEADTRKGSASYGGSMDPSRFVPLISLTKSPGKPTPAPSSVASSSTSQPQQNLMGTPSSSSSGGGVGDALDKKVLTFISQGEAASGDPYGGFNVSAGRTPGRAVDHTIGWLAKNAKGAMGRYQQMPQFILDRAKAAGFNENTKFTPEVQDKITLKQLESHSYNQWKSGKVSDEYFLGRLAATWRAIPQGPANAAKLGGSPDGTYNDGTRNRSSGTWKGKLATLKSLKSSSSQSIASQSSPSQPEPQIGSVNSQGKIYVDSKYGYQSRATIIAKGLLPSQNINPQPSTPQQNLVNPPGALAPGQRPDRALTSEQLKIAQQTREQGKASGLTGEALEKSVAAAVMASSSTTQQTPAQISQSSTQAQQNQQLSQQITPDRKGQTIIFQQPSQSQSLSYSTGGGSGMMPISVNEIALVNNFMKKKLLLDLAYL